LGEEYLPERVKEALKKAQRLKVKHGEKLEKRIEETISNFEKSIGTLLAGDTSELYTLPKETIPRLQKLLKAMTKEQKEKLEKILEATLDTLRKISNKVPPPSNNLEQDLEKLRSILLNRDIRFDIDETINDLKYSGETLKLLYDFYRELGKEPSNDLVKTALSSMYLSIDHLVRTIGSIIREKFAPEPRFVEGSFAKARFILSMILSSKSVEEVENILRNNYSVFKDLLDSVYYLYTHPELARKYLDKILELGEFLTRKGGDVRRIIGYIGTLKSALASLDALKRDLEKINNEKLRKIIEGYEKDIVESSIFMHDLVYDFNSLINMLWSTIDKLKSALNLAERIMHSRTGLAKEVISNVYDAARRMSKELEYIISELTEKMNKAKTYKMKSILGEFIGIAERAKEKLDNEVLKRARKFIAPGDPSAPHKAFDPYRVPIDPKLLDAVSRAIEKAAEVPTSKTISESPYRAFSIERAMERIITKKPLSYVYAPRAMTNVLVMLDTSGSMTWFSDLISALMRVYKKLGNLEIYDTPNGYIEKNLVTGKRVPQDLIEKLRGRIIIYVGDFDGSETVFKLAKNNKVIWIAPEVRYKDTRDYGFSFSLRNFEGMFLRVETEKDLIRAFNTIAAIGYRPRLKLNFAKVKRESKQS